MVQLIMIVIKVAWLAASYTMVFSFLSGNISGLIAWCITVFGWFEYIIPFITAAVGTIRWLIGNVPFTFAVICWLALPMIKMTIYFTHKAASFGGLAAHAVDISSKSSNSN